MPHPTARRVPLGVLLALAAALYACRSREGDRCVCADDCREGLVCLAQGRVLTGGECSPASTQDSSPGVCLSEDEAADGDDGGALPPVFMDLGAKRDFDPGLPPGPDTDTDTDASTGTSTTDPGTSSSGSSTGGSSSGSSSDSGSTTGPMSTGSTGGSTSSGSSSSSSSSVGI